MYKRVLLAIAAGAVLATGTIGFAALPALAGDPPYSAVRDTPAVSSAPSPRPGTLPRTGAPLSGISLAGVALVGLGAVLLVTSRRHREHIA
ncbi:LPXTG cell wall anchor domain-containing protein [Catellatospora sp. NPDC049111]|uniref:LPXTG cell wall anchor domain-containing protein n=1 Tax=Catellatospora sp. NPDC049111 TaxID=3155271 RepID=UPI0033FADE8E